MMGVDPDILFYGIALIVLVIVAVGGFAWDHRRYERGRDAEVASLTGKPLEGE